MLIQGRELNTSDIEGICGLLRVEQHTVESRVVCALGLAQRSGPSQGHGGTHSAAQARAGRLHRVARSAEALPMRAAISTLRPSLPRRNPSAARHAISTPWARPFSLNCERCNPPGSAQPPCQAERDLCGTANFPTPRRQLSKPYSASSNAPRRTIRPCASQSQHVPHALQKYQIPCPVLQSSYTRPLSH